ncbi:MAG: hypothetical protein LBI94_08575 [Treponema sp.]|jgi:hypothetical protein|nr:hypothetical protein [Treponema sp.]
MAKKRDFVIRTVLFVFLAASFTGCPTDSEEPAPTLKGLLVKYMAPKVQPGDNGEVAYYYYLDPSRFDEFKAELEAGGEYIPSDDWTNDDQNNIRRNNARWENHTGTKYVTYELHLYTTPKSERGYRYVKDPKAAGLTVDKLLREYLGPNSDIWGTNEGETPEEVDVYNLDPARFDEFKAEVEALGEYTQSDDYEDETRTWEQGKTFAEWIEHSNGVFELRLCNKDNSVRGYRYKKGS